MEMHSFNLITLNHPRLRSIDTLNDGNRDNVQNISKNKKYVTRYEDSGDNSCTKII